jgi:nucleotide-binding universal stress UspA family protein
MSVLVPVDGSSRSLNAVRHVIALRASGMRLKVHLLNVQAGLIRLPRDYAMRETGAFQALAADNATRAARALLAGARIEFESHLRFGDTASAIVRFARQGRCGKIVMGTRRLGTLAGVVTGSVAKRVLRLSAVPITLVREA